ncbi:MAG: hypothetical protein L6R36_007667 [Xanthoria steineri]|nr:MAG: hypothetical protein L6R36_007667 [Xanthoria steineri]
MPFGLSWNKPWSHLFALPNEVILHIASFLPLSSQLALSITCQHFRRLFYERLGLTVVLAFSTQQPSCKSGSWVVHHYLGHERRVYLSLVERLDASTLWCSYCTCHHPRSSFGLRMQRTQRHLRRCRNAEAVMWICPQRLVDHETMKSARTGIAQGSLYCRRSHSVQIRPEGIQIERPIRYLHHGETSIPYTQLKTLMKRRSVHLCPHLLFSSQQVYKAAKSPHPVLFTLSPFRRLKEHLKSALEKSKRHLKGLGRSSGSRTPTTPTTNSNTCPECKTHWHWTLNDKHDVLSLIITRPFATTNSVDDPQWVHQTVSPPQVEELAKEWGDDLDAFELLVEELALQDARDRDIMAGGGGGFGSDGGRSIGIRRARRRRGYSSLGS